MANLENLTKKELREALDNYKRILNRYTGIFEKDVRFLEGLGYEIVDECLSSYKIRHGNVVATVFFDKQYSNTAVIMHSFNVDGLEEKIMTEDIEEALNDITGAYQKNFLEYLDLQPVELYIKELINTEVTFEKQIKGNDEKGYRLELISQDVKEHCGIFGNILESATIDTFGSIHFYISNEGNQELDIPPINISYKHKDGGSNGMHIASNIEYDLANNKWLLRSRQNGHFSWQELSVQYGKLVKEEV